MARRAGPLAGGSGGCRARGRRARWLGSPAHRHGVEHPALSVGQLDEPTHSLSLCLCVLALGKAGTWVLAIGAMRYLLVAAMWPWPWLAMPLPESWRRKAICVWQVASLVCALSPWVMPHVAAPLLWSSLALLGWSFAVDVRWLHSKARGRA